MQFTDKDLRAASTAGVIDPTQLTRLMEFLDGRTKASATGPKVAATGPKFDVAHLLWYAGALIIITAMGLFSTLAFSQMGGKALAITAFVYAAAFGVAGHYLWYRRDLRTPGGLLLAIAVSMAPLAVFGIQEALGWWGQLDDPGAYQGFYANWIFMEVAAIVAAAVALRYYPFPFIVSIVAVALWLMSMDLTSWIAGTEYADWERQRGLSVWFGGAVLAVAYIVDQRQRTGDFAFWLYLFGLMAFWGAITASASGSHFAKALYCAMNIGFLFLSVFLNRRVFAVFGVMGVSIYLGNLASQVFRDSLMVPFALSLIGVAVIAAGLYYHRNQAAISGWLDAHLSPAVKRLRPLHAR
jgi:hypothetical protein